MKKLSSKSFLSFLFPALIILVALILFYTNYQPGTFLSGWDTLHPEFNLGLYLKRAFWGVWQEHQGVGAVASQAHAAELPRLLIIGLLNLILPINLVRYSFFFLTLGMGGLGAYYLSKYLLSVHSERFSREASFLAALFYILNLATVQQFYVPLEMFAVHFATLPWLLFLAIAYLREGKKKLLIAFSVTTIFSASMAHTPTLFYAYLGAFVLFLISAFIFVRRGNIFKRGVVLIGLTLALNLYWLAPNIYFLANHAQDVTNSKIHRVFSDEAFLQSEAYGDYKNINQLKNFLFNWREYNFSQGKFVDLMDEWQGYGYSLTLIVILGLLVAAVRKQKYALAFLPVLAACIFFLINANPPFTAVFDFLRARFDLFREGLRFPFTKFSILLVACVSVYLAFAAQFIMQVLGKIKLGFLFLVLSSSLLVYSMLPAFKGDFISPSMKVNIPSEYFQMFDWFNKQDPTARVAKLPLNTFWGWNYYAWGYQGAGFTWFGIPQPTFDREFDRWSPHNETFYSQASFALYDKDLQAFEKVIQKFQVRYLLLDESIVNAGGTDKVLFIPEIKQLLSESKHIRLEKKFGFLSVYKTDFELGKDFVTTPKNYLKTNSSLIYSDIDPVFLGYPLLVKPENDILGRPIIVEDLTTTRGFAQATNCDLLKVGSVEKTIVEKGILYQAGGGGVSCDFLDYLDLKYSGGYVLRIKGENLKGRSLKIYLNNVSTGRMDLEELLPKGKFDETFTIHPKKTEGEGYVLNLETRSYGKVASGNILEAMEFYKLPENYITSLYSDIVNIPPTENNLEILDLKKIGSFYRVETARPGLLVLGQGYEKGWVALAPQPNSQSSIINFQLLKHVKVDGWANGWEVQCQRINDKCQIVIIFWPQLLEFAGLLILIVTLVLLVGRRVDKE